MTKGKSVYAVLNSETETLHLKLFDLFLKLQDLIPKLAFIILNYQALFLNFPKSIMNLLNLFLILKNLLLWIPPFNSEIEVCNSSFRSLYCVKIVRIRSLFDLHFLAFGKIRKKNLQIWTLLPQCFLLKLPKLFGNFLMPKSETPTLDFLNSRLIVLLHFFLKFPNLILICITSHFEAVGFNFEIKNCRQQLILAL